MREIKFRAWDKEKKTLKYFDTLTARLPSNWKDFYESSQYTGLKDKNGKEIYEGDILTTKRQWHSGFDVQIDVVKWKSHYTMNGFWPFLHFNEKDVYEVEIIGNIYENKELLNG